MTWLPSILASPGKRVTVAACLMAPGIALGQPLDEARTASTDDVIAACIEEADRRGVDAAGTVEVARPTADVALAFSWAGDPLDHEARLCVERALSEWAHREHEDAESLSMRIAFDTTTIIAARDLLDEDGEVVEGAVRFDLEDHWDTPLARQQPTGSAEARYAPAEEQMDAFQATLATAAADAEACYREQFGADGPMGRVAIQLGVGYDGVVEEATVVGRPLDDEVAACVLQQARRLRFPRSAAGADLIWPVAFAP